MPDHRRLWAVLAVASASAFVASFDGSALSVALPSASTSLHLTYSVALWVPTAYLLTVSVLLLPLGRSADRAGRHGHNLLGVTIFTVASASAGLAGNALWLIASRCAQGVGAALIVTTSAALAVTAFPQHERGRALGLNTLAVYAGLLAGAPVGGFLVSAYSWRFVFAADVVMGATTLALGVRLLGRRSMRQAPRHRSRPSADFGGSLLLAVSLICLVAPVTFAGLLGWLDPRVILPLAVSALAIPLFVLVERRSRDPLLDVAACRHNRILISASAAALLNYVAMYATAVLTAIFLELVQMRSARSSGLILLAQPALMVIVAPIAGRLYDIVGSRLLTASGQVIAAAGALSLATMPLHASWVRVTLDLALVGTGMALFAAPNIAAVLGSVSSDQLSFASSFLGTMRYAGQAISVAVLGAIAASRLGESGTSRLFSGDLGAANPALFASGYRLAMIVGACLAVCGALVSSLRGTKESRESQPELD
jgi:EmrB/QacA subfamily drug resistance transporter